MTPKRRFGSSKFLSENQRIVRHTGMRIGAEKCASSSTLSRFTRRTRTGATVLTSRVACYSMTRTEDMLVSLSPYMRKIGQSTMIVTPSPARLSNGRMAGVITGLAPCSVVRGTEKLAIGRIRQSSTFVRNLAQSEDFEIRKAGRKIAPSWRLDCEEIVKSLTSLVRCSQSENLRLELEHSATWNISLA